jgi:hypothetical protein
MPAKKLKTGRAKARGFCIRIFDSGRRVHNTAPLPAVHKSKGVTQFVERRLFNARDQEFSVWRLSVELGKEPMYGNQRTQSVHLRNSIDVLKDRDV